MIRMSDRQNTKTLPLILQYPDIQYIRLSGDPVLGYPYIRLSENKQPATTEP